MSRRVVEYLNIGCDQKVDLNPKPEGVTFLARLIPVVDIKTRIEQSPLDLDDIFTSGEILYSRRYKRKPFERFAARLGAKQIALGLVDSPELGWKDCEVTNSDLNSPSLVLSAKAQGLIQGIGLRGLHISLAHETDAAVALCATERYEEGQPANLIRIGTDICPASPFEIQAITRTSTFSEEELETAKLEEFPARYLAMCFSAKETVVKILETLPGWIWKEIEIHKVEGDSFKITLSGSAQERFEQIGAQSIVTNLIYKDHVGALAFSAALRAPIDRAYSR